MTSGQDPIAAAKSTAGKRRNRRTTDGIGFRHRIEPALLFVLSMLAFVLLVLAGTAAIVETRNGYLDPPIVEPLPDRRILTNIRTPSHAPFADAVLDDRSGTLLAIRKDGLVHRFDRRTQLIGEEDVRADRGTTGAVALASHGCGQTGGGDLSASDPCGLDGVTFATTTRGGLALRSERGTWRTLVGDATWIGLNGQPVTDDDLIDWTVSDDRRWVLMSAGTQGLGLFDVATSTIIAAPDTAQDLARAAPDGVTRLLFTGGRFWTGSEAGIAALRITRGRVDVQPVISARVLDLEKQGPGGDGLLAVLSAGCDASDCLQIARIDPAGAVTRLVGEDEHHPGLGNDVLHYARQQGDSVVVLGSTGIYAYDIPNRGWRGLSTGPVTAHRTDPDDTLHAAIGSKVFSVSSGQVAASQDLPHAPIVQITRSDPATRLAISEDGAVMNVETGAVLFAPTSTPFDPATARQAAAVGNRLFMQSPAGVLIHDLDQSRYSWVPTRQLPLPLKSQPELLAADGKLWAASREQGWIALIFADDTPSGVTLDASDPLRFNTPLASVNTASGDLTLVDTDGVPYRISTGPDGPEATPLVGPSRPQTGTLIALASNDDRLLASQGGEVMEYRYDTRGWSMLQRFDPAIFQVRDIALGRAGFALGQSGKVHQLSDNGPLPLVGAGPLWPFGSHEVSDARTNLGLVVLAGNGYVAAYDAREGKITRIWKGGAGPVRLLGFDGFDPLWIAGEAVYLGGQRISTPAETIRTAWIEDQQVVLVRQEGPGQASVRVTPIARGDGNSASAPPPDRCYFTRPKPAGATFHDALDLGSGRVFVLTDAGAQIYDRQARRWLDVAGAPAGLDLIEPLANGVVLARDTALWWMDGIAVDDACASDTARLKTTATPTRAHALAPDRSSVALIAEDGAVFSATGAKSFVPLAAAPGPSPDPAKLGRAIYGQPLWVVHFAGHDGIWTYDGRNRQWTQTPITGGPADPSNTDMLSLPDGTFAMTQWDDAGQAWGGLFDPAALGPASLRPVAQPFLTDFPVASAGIRDVVEQGTTWFFVLDDRLLAYDTANRTYTGELSLPASRDDWALHSQNGLLTLVAAGAAANRWLLPSAPQTWAGDTVQTAGYAVPDLSDLSSAVVDPDDPHLWRVTHSGEVMLCPVRWGGSTQTTCTLTNGPPPPLPRSDVIDAFAFADGIAIHTPSGLYHLGKDLRTLKPFANADRIDPDTKFHDLGDAVLAFTAEGNLLALTESLSMRPIASGISQLINGSQGEIFARRDDRFFRVNPTGLTAIGPADPRQQRFMSYDTTFRSLNRAGWFVDQRGTRLPAAQQFPVADTDLAAIPDSYVALPEQTGNEGAWVQGPDGSLRYWAARRCGKPPAPEANCLEPLLRIDAPRAPDGRPEKLLRAASDSFGRILRFETQDLFLRRGETEPEPRGRTSPVWPRPGTVTSEAQNIRQAITEIAGQDVLFAPRMSENLGTVTVRIGTLSEDRPGSMTSTPLDGARSNWLSFDRDSRSFEILSSSTKLPVAQAVEDGKFIWSAPGRWSHLGGSDWVKATRAGTFTFQDDGVRVTALDLTQKGMPEHLDLGRFFLDGENVIWPGRQAATAPLLRGLNIDDLQIETDVATGLSTTSVPVGGTNRPALTANGFIFDQRQVIGWAGERIHYGSRNVIGPADRIENLIALPDGGADALITISDDLFARQGSSFFKRNPDGSWSPTPDPEATADLARNGGLTWSRLDGVGRVAATRADQAWRATRDGLGFRADQLIDATANDGTLLALSGLGLHRFGTLSGLLVGAASDPNAPADAQSVDHAITGPGSDLFWADTGRGRMVLDTTSNSWSNQTPAPAPWDSRTPVSGGLITVQLDRGGATLSRLVGNLDGTDRSFEFQWTKDARFPFDTARAIHAAGDTLWVGTEAGLRELRTGSTRQNRLIALDRATTGRPAPVTDIGKPLSDPSRVHARSFDFCAILSDPAAPPCDPRALDIRVQADTDLWLWQHGPDGLSGQYRDRTGRSFGAAIGMNAPRWPHDTIALSQRCDGQRHEIWRDREVATDDQGLTDISGAPLSALHCVEKDRPLGHAEVLPSGLYGTGPVPLTFAGQWSQVSGVDQHHIRDLSRYAYYRDRMRLTRPDGDAGLMLEHRTAADEWAPLAWDKGRLAIDAPGRLTHRQGEVWRYAPQSFIETAVTDTSLRLDPDRLEILRPPTPAMMEACTPDALASFDGTDGDWPAVAADPTRLRCTDGRIYEVRLTAGNRAITSAQSDPFLARTFLDTPDLWTWKNDTAKPGSRGTLDITFRGEPVRLAGRFPFDSYQSIAQTTAADLNIIAMDGWWTSDPSARLPATARPDDQRIAAASVGDLLPNPVADGAEQPGALCLSLPQRKAILAADGTLTPSQDCIRAQGFDGFWRYSTSPAGLSATGEALNGGKVRRTLHQGRFGDLFILAPPSGDAATPGTVFARSVAGVTQLKLSGGVDGILAVSPDDLPVSGPDGRLSLLTAAGPQPVEADAPAALACAGLSLRQPLADGERLAQAVLTPAGGFETTVISDDDDATVSRRSFVACGPDATPIGWYVPTDVADRFRFKMNRSRWPEAEGQLATWVRNGRITSGSGANQVTRLLPGTGRPLRLLTDKLSGKTFILTTNNIFWGDHDALMKQINLAPDTAPSPDPATLGRADSPDLLLVRWTPRIATEVQQKLTDLGFHDGKITGLFDAPTIEAVKAFQSGLGEPSDGQLTQVQLRTLRDMAGGR